MSYWIALLICVVANIGSNVAFKTAVKNSDFRPTWDGALSLFYQPFFWMGCLCAGLVLLSYLYSLKGLPMSLSYPFVATVAMVCVSIVGHTVFGEPLGLGSIAGICLAAAGVGILALTHASQ